MKKVISLVLVGIICLFQESRANELKWITPKVKLRSVFTPAKKSQNIELIRLYTNNTFEHLIYTPAVGSVDQTGSTKGHRSTVVCNRGTYSLASGTLKMSCTTEEFDSDIYKQEFFIDGNAYENKLASKRRKKEFVLRSVNRSKNDFPFYLDPISHSVVYNQDASTHLDLEDLVKFIVRDAHTEQTKLEAIRAYVLANINYDAKGAKKEIFSNDQNDIATLLAGQNRVALSGGFSTTMKALCELAGLESRYVEGYVKMNALYSGERHAWNVIKIGREYQIHDVTWGEKWGNVNPAIMIHSHFPDKQSDQLLKSPVELDEFKTMAYVEPRWNNGKYVGFIPARAELHANNKLEVLFDGRVASAIVELREMNIETGSTSSSATKIAGVKTISSGGGTKLIIPISFEKGEVSIRLSNGMEIEFIVLNDGVEEKDISEFYQNNKIEYFHQAENTLVANSTNKASTFVNGEVGESKAAWDKASYAFLKKLSDLDFKDALLMNSPLIRQARKYYGIVEIPGDQHNSQIVTFFKETGNEEIKTDEAAWCSTFIGYCAKQAGLEYSKESLAQSWLNFGKEIKDPVPGDLVIFWRDGPTSWKGHVAIFLGFDELTKEVICLGGNQSDSVCISQYAIDRVLGYRRLEKSQD
ncbi:MAG: hypothetical protein ACI837_002141 [Crocinitomicaceae bacterium]|jgi:uncharacterized protein (TIGR02594 family)